MAPGLTHLSRYFLIVGRFHQIGGQHWSPRSSRESTVPQRQITDPFHLQPLPATSWSVLYTAASLLILRKQHPHRLTAWLQKVTIFVRRNLFSLSTIWPKDFMTDNKSTLCCSTSPRLSTRFPIKLQHYVVRGNREWTENFLSTRTRKSSLKVTSHHPQ